MCKLQDHVPIYFFPTAPFAAPAGAFGLGLDAALILVFPSVTPAPNLDGGAAGFLDCEAAGTVGFFGAATGGLLALLAAAGVLGFLATLEDGGGACTRLLGR